MAHVEHMDWDDNLWDCSCGEGDQPLPAFWSADEITRPKVLGRGER